jgi:large subunit ribosomal protein L25
MEAVLEAVRREAFGRNNAGRMRRAGRIPAVIYGAKGASESLAVDPKQLLHILHSEAGLNSLITLKVEGAGAEAHVLVKEFQLHPVTQQLLHADFYRVAMDKITRVTVPVHLTGEAKGVKAEGGIVDFVHREVLVECLPADIPKHIVVDVSELMMHDGVRVRDLVSDGKWRPVSDADMLIVHVVPLKAEVEAVPADAVAAVPAAPAEPEVIKKGKAEKEEEKE